MTPALLVEGVSKYFGDFPALRNVSFQVSPGSVVALVTGTALVLGFHGDTAWGLATIGTPRRKSISIVSRALWPVAKTIAPAAM